uniref:ADP/ATP translocase n=1 Tax=Strix occidentalis caurina TaxID=311401 RepID=A0A8D0FI23_STROC
MEQKQRAWFLGPDVLASNMAAAISKMVVVPVKQVKLFLQVQGMVDCFVHIPREQGFFSFWHDSLANVIHYFPTQALNFSFKDKYKQIFMSRKHSKLHLISARFEIHFTEFVQASIFALFCRDYCQIQTKLSFILSFFTAEVVTTCSGMLSYPFDTVRRHMMMQVRWSFQSFFERLNAFFCGTFSNILCGTGRALVLVLYDKIKAIFNLHVFREFRI